MYKSQVLFNKAGDHSIRSNAYMKYKCHANFYFQFYGLAQTI